MTKTDLAVVLTTAGSEREAADTARTLVEERLAACVNRIAVASTYRWQGDVLVDVEQLLVIKTTSDRLDAIEARISELSSYDVPEFVVLDAARVSQSYLAWLSESCARST